MAQVPTQHSTSGVGRTGLHPALNAFHVARSADLQLRVADAITAFAGSMPFVYIHAAAFAAWMLLAEHRPELIEADKA